MVLYMYIALEQGQITNEGQNNDVNKNLLALWPSDASSKNISLNCDFMQFFHDFMYVYNARAGTEDPIGIEF